MVKFYKEADQPIYLLLDVRGTFVNPEVMDKLKHYGKTVFNGRSAKRAILGVTGVKKILLKGYNLFTSTSVTPFETEVEAKDYLAQ